MDEFAAASGDEPVNRLFAGSQPERLAVGDGREPAAHESTEVKVNRSLCSASAADAVSADEPDNSTAALACPVAEPLSESYGVCSRTSEYRWFPSGP